jgi:hypothetical protein
MKNILIGFLILTSFSSFASLQVRSPNECKEANNLCFAMTETDNGIFFGETDARNYLQNRVQKNFSNYCTGTVKNVKCNVENISQPPERGEGADRFMAICTGFCIETL